MKYKKIIEIAFSPCFSTDKTASVFAEELSDKLNVVLIKEKFTLPQDRNKTFNISDDSLAVIASPTYAGKLPNKILSDFQNNIKGNKGPAIAIVTYGNRSFDNSLAELSKTLTDNNFSLIAAAAFVNEHTMSHIAPGRPNRDDIAEIRAFAGSVAEKIMKNDMSAPAVPGNADAPYYVPKQENGEPAKFLPAKPKTDLSKCTQCGACARMCPMGSINPDNTSEVSGICIKCHACVNRCTRNAKYFDDEQLLSHIRMLQNNFSEENKNECCL